MNAERCRCSGNVHSYPSAFIGGLLLLLSIASSQCGGAASARAAQGPTAVAPGTKKTNQEDRLNYVWIPSGTFQMGCSNDDNACKDHENERPSHAVTLTKGFWMGESEVTVGAYKRFAQAKGRSMPSEPISQGRALNEGWRQQEQPIVQVTFHDAKAYCEWAGGRLPTEAEWEYAARGGSAAAQYGPLDQIAWYANTSGESPLDSTAIAKAGPQGALARRFLENRNGLRKVAQKRPNAFGLYDTLGNAWEWVADWYDDKHYAHSPLQDPPGPLSGQYRVLRGGAWNSPPWHVRVSDRIWHEPTVANIVFGFRCVSELP